jgi:hypothetical protein
MQSDDISDKTNSESNLIRIIRCAADMATAKANSNPKDMYWVGMSVAYNAVLDMLGFESTEHLGKDGG